jgi:hypothetical protein
MAATDTLSEAEASRKLETARPEFWHDRARLAEGRIWAGGPESVGAVVWICVWVAKRVLHVVDYVLLEVRVVE